MGENEGAEESQVRNDESRKMGLGSTTQLRHFLERERGERGIEKWKMVKRWEEEEGDEEEEEDSLLVRE